MRAPALIASVLALLAAAPRASAEPAIWTIRDKDSVIVLFGSFHILPRGQAWRPAALDQALAKADDLWFEIPMDGDSAAAIAQASTRNSLLPPGERLTRLLSRAGRKRLQRVAMQVGVPLDTLDRMQPWYAEAVLGVAVYRRQGAVAEAGVERQLSDSAPPGVPRRAFETADQQIAFFSGGARKAQIASLEDTLRQFEEDPGYMPRVLKLWLAGDAKGLDRTVLRDLRREAPDQYRQLIVARNRAWLPVILKRLAGSGETVMVVGVGHLVGPDGLPALLRKRGIEVEGP